MAVEIQHKQNLNFTDNFIVYVTADDGSWWHIFGFTVHQVIC